MSIFEKIQSINLSIGREKSYKRYAFISCFLFSSGQSLFFVLYPILALKMATNISTVIEIFTIGSFLFIFTLPIWMSVSDRYGKVFTSKIGVFGLFLSLALLFLAQSYAQINNPLAMRYLWGSRIVFGIFSSCVIPMGQAIFADSKDGVYLKNIAQFSQATAMGRIVGPMIAIVGMELSLAMVLIIQMILCFLVLFYGASTPQDFILASERKNAFSGVLKLNSLFVVGAAVFLVAISITGVQSLQAGFMEQQIEGLMSVSSSVIALSFILANLGMILAQHRISGMRDRALNKLLLGSSLSLFAAIIIFCCSEHWSHTMLGFIIFGVSSSGIRVGLMSFFCMKNETKKKAGIAVINIMQTTGYAVGIIMSYTTIHSFGLSYQTLCVFSAALIVLVLVTTRGSFFNKTYVN